LRKPVRFRYSAATVSPDSPNGEREQVRLSIISFFPSRTFLILFEDQNSARQNFFSFMKKNNKKIIWLGLALSLFFFLIFFFTKNIGQNASYTSPPLPAQIETEKVNQAILQVNDEKIETAIVSGENVYDFMTELQKEGKINFEDKNYSGMGELVEEINGIKNNGDKNWIYYVNGKKATIGISNYKIKPGDVVSWKYEKDIN